MVDLRIDVKVTNLGTKESVDSFCLTDDKLPIVYSMINLGRLMNQTGFPEDFLLTPREVKQKTIESLRGRRAKAENTVAINNANIKKNRYVIDNYTSRVHKNKDQLLSMDMDNLEESKKAISLVSELHILLQGMLDLVTENSNLEKENVQLHDQISEDLRKLNEALKE